MGIKHLQGRSMKKPVRSLLFCSSCWLFLSTKLLLVKKQLGSMLRPCHCWFCFLFLNKQVTASIVGCLGLATVLPYFPQDAKRVHMTEHSGIAIRTSLVLRDTPLQNSLFLTSKCTRACSQNRLHQLYNQLLQAHATQAEYTLPTQAVAV